MRRVASMVPGPALAASWTQNRWWARVARIVRATQCEMLCVPGLFRPANLLPSTAAIRSLVVVLAQLPVTPINVVSRSRRRFRPATAKYGAIMRRRARRWKPRTARSAAAIQADEFMAR